VGSTLDVSGARHRSACARAIARDIGAEVVEADPLERDWLQGMKNFTALLAKVLRK